MLPLPAKVERALARHAEHQEEERQAWGQGWNENGLVFRSLAGAPIEPRNLVRQFKTLLSARTCRISGFTICGTAARRR